MTTVAITGASGLVGRRVVRRVALLPGVDQVVRVDLHDPDPTIGDGRFVQADVTDLDQVRAALDGADVVLHLAFQVDPIADLDRMREVNVEGTRNVCTVLAEVGAGKLVHASSTTAYGAHPDNAVPLSEEAPLRANPDFPYAEHKAEVDRLVAGFAEAHPDVCVTRFRIATVAGAGIDNFLSRTLLSPRLPTVRGHRPPFQFVHVDDVAAAFAHAVGHDLPGAYNVAAPGWLSFDEFRAILGRPVLDVPEEVAFTTVERLTSFGLAELPVGAVHYLMHPWVASGDRLVATGWRAEHSNRDAAATLAAEVGDRLQLGPVRTDRATVRRAAGVGAGLAGGLLALGVLSRRRRGGEA